MNNIYKVIWSKAKNCYVVASEIARSHTKSATGSKKIGGVTRRSLLASLMALSLLCGGLGVASAANGTVHVAESVPGTAEVYTAEKVDTLLSDKADKTALDSKANETEVVKNTKDIATNKENIQRLDTDKLSKEVASVTYATNKALNDLENAVTNKVDESAFETALEGKADATALDDKADKTTVDALDGRVGNVEGKVTALETTVGDASSGLVKDVNDLRNQGNTLNSALGNKADKTELDAAKEKITTNETNIIALQKKTTGLSEDGKSLNSMNNVETGALKVTGKISDGTVNTTLAEIDASMKQTETNKEDIANLKTTTGEQDTAIKDLQKKTTNISYADGAGTSIDGITVKDGNIVGNGNSAITGLTNVETSQINGKSLAGTTVATATEVETETLARKEADNKLDQKIDKEIQDRDVADAALEGKITTLDGKVTTDIADLKAKDIELEGRIHTNEGNIETNKNAIAATDKRTAGIDRIDATKETTIEGNVTVDNLGNVKAKGGVTADGKLKGAGVDAGDGAITTTGAVNAGSLIVENASNLKGDVTMDNNLTVKGDTSLKKTDVDGALTAKGDVTLGTPNGMNTVTVNGTAHFNEAVNMDKGLTVTSGESNLKNTTVDGNLKVTGTITTDKMVFGETPNNYTEIDKGKVTSKNLVVNRAGQAISSSSTFDVEKNEVGFGNGITDEQSSHKQTSDVITDTVKNNNTGDQSFHKQTSDVIMDNVKDGKNSNNRTQTKTETKDIITDENGNSSTTSQTASQNKTYLKDKDGKNINSTIDTAKGYDKTIKGENGETSTKQDEFNITNTAKDGTITNDAQNIVNNASGNITNKANTMDTNVTGKATESYGELETNVNGKATENFKGGLDTTVTGAENHTVTGKQTNTVEGGQENIISGGQINKITGDQTTTVTGDISNKAKNITNEATEKLTDKVGTNTRVIDSTSITDTVGTTTNRKIEDGKITDTAGDSTVTTENGKGTTFVKTDSAAVSTEAGAPKDTNIAGNLITTGRVDANELGVSDKDGANTADLSVKAGEGVKASAGNGTTTGSLDVKADEVGSSVKDDASGKGSTFKQRIDAIMGNVKNNTTGEESFHKQTSDIIMDNVKDQDNSNNRTQTKTETKDIITDKDGNSSTTSQTASKNKTYLKDKDGKNTNSTIDTAKGYDKTIKGENGETSTKQDAKDITNTAKGGTIKNDANDIVNNAQETITNKAGTSITNQVNNSRVTTDANGTTFENNTAAVSDGGTTKTKINGNLINTGRVDANELKVSDKEGDNSANLSVKAGEGVKASASDGITTGSLDVTADKVGSSVKDASGNGSTFKQRIDAIMGNVKNNTTGEESFHKQTSDIIMDNVKDGDNSNNRTQTKTETKDIITDKDGNSSTTSQTASKNKTYLKDKDGKNTNSTIDTAKGYDKTIKGENGETSTQQTDSMVQSYVGKKDGSATNVTTNLANASANQVTENGQTSTVLNNKDGLLIQNTANGTSFTTADGTNTGTAQAWTNVKGNEISTGKVEANYVKMDYADVMKDLGVRGNAKVGKNLEVTGTSTLTGDVTMGSNATVNGNFNVEGNTNLKNTQVDGTLKVTKMATFDDSVSIAKDLSVGGDVTASSYQVGDKTYIDANGIHANGQKITDVADGSISEGSKDAVNGGQLYGMKNDLEGKVNKVGANAAAMANLHPMEFDPDSKWNIAAAIGNYGSETAAALGAFYRPNDDVMVNLSTAFGTGENMVGGGVSVRLGKGGNKLSREENNALKDQVNDLTARMDALLSVLNPNMSKDFPDVPENHWAYEAVSRLAGNDIVQGYPDGEFHGERTMTRYEMAEIIYNALSRGAEAEKELVEEFKPELQAMAASEKATAEKAEG